MNHQLPTSSSAARIDGDVREPWQLVAHNGAGWLLVGLTMPAVISWLQTLSMTSLQGTVTDWNPIILALRIGRGLAGVIGFVGLLRLLRAPCIDHQRRVLVLLLYFASAIMWPLFGRYDGVLSLMAPVATIASWVTLIEAMRTIEIEAMRTIEGAAGNDGRGLGLWRAVTVFAILSSGIVASFVPMGEPMYLLLGVLTVVKVALLAVCFSSLRKKLC